MDIYELENELYVAKGDLAELAEALKTAAIVEANARSDYEDAKNKLIIILREEEVKEKIKRTDMIRTAIYRDQLKSQRRAWLLAEADMKSNRDLLKGLISKVDSLRSLISLAKSQMELS